MTPLKKQYKHRPISKNASRGVALVISLILLVVMTIFGLTGVKLVSSEERMVGQVYDRTLAFQAAESSLREAELLIEELGQPSPAAGSACVLTAVGAKSLMTCGAPSAAEQPRWLDTDFSEWSDGTAVGKDSLEITPQYFVEYLGDNFPCGFDPSTAASTCKRYRITARARPGSGRANVVLQSVYATS
jgi:type IV pilus assembly protein PilX